MKIGILSMTWGYNYGATLQSYALRQTVAHLGHEARVIDYQPARFRLPSPWRGWGLARPSLPTIRAKANQALRLGIYTRRYDAFKAKHLGLTAPCRTSQDIDQKASGFDALIVGSDQIWNPAYQTDPVFYLRIAGYSGKKISYAACCGDESNKPPPWTAEALCEFDAVSVRNTFTARWVDRATAGRVTTAVVADPTLLLANVPCAEPKGLPAEFIAAYLIGAGEDGTHRRIIAALRERHGALPVVCLMPTGIWVTLRPWANQTMWNLDPFEWVQCIRRASALYTDSFHAALFAIRFHIDFRAVWFEAIRSSRLRDVAEVFGLQGNILPAAEAAGATDPPAAPDWQEIDRRMAEQRARSLGWLKWVLD